MTSARSGCGKLSTIACAGCTRSALQKSATLRRPRGGPRYQMTRPRRFHIEAAHWENDPVEAKSIALARRLGQLHVGLASLLERHEDQRPEDGPSTFSRGSMQTRPRDL